MRMAFGLIGVLVTIGVMVWIISAVEAPSMQQAANAKKKLEPQVQQMAGKGTDGEDARNSIKLDSETRNGKMSGVLVTAISPGGPMETYFGLKRGDVIVEIAPQGGAMMPVSDMATPAEAKDYLLTSFQNSQQIVVMRSEQKMTLPVAAAKPATPAGGGANSGDALQKQLDAIKSPAQ
jgi:hypothetical protein